MLSSNIVSQPFHLEQTPDSPPDIELPFPAQLSLKLVCNTAKKTAETTDEKTNISHRYMAYPLSVSPVFRLEENGSVSSSNRAYLYRMNTSPGLLAGDKIGMSLQLAAGAQLYLADQSATKVHTMPQPSAQATVNHWIELGDRATLEFLSEPLILFADSTLTQTTEIVMHPTASLSLGEIILPGRLARGEAYEFRQYLSRLRVKSPQGQVWFTETMKLLGKENRFAKSALFGGGSVLGSLVLILPEGTRTHLAALSTAIDNLIEPDGSMDVASSVLPGGRGLFVRAIAQTTRDMQACFKGALNAVRKLRGQAPLPYSV
jgi:urease accessory protein